MLVMTAKVDKKKFAIVAAAILALLAALFLLGGKNDAEQTIATNAGSNDDRVAFLTGFGWEVDTSPTESSQVRIPSTTSEVFDRYNTLQKSQGYDLSQYAGKNVMRYVYHVKNFPGATEPVYATLLVYKNQIIGGDVTNTAANGSVQGFTMPKTEAAAPQASESTTGATEASE